MNGSAILEMTSIVKSFNGVPVLKNVDVRLDSGTVVGLLGENGAGKSTLIKILCGAYQADSGIIEMDGRVVSIPDTAHAKELGIQTVYQELSLFPSMRVYENIFMNAELSGRSSLLLAPLHTAQMIREAHEVLENRLGVSIDVRRRVADLTLAEQQLVEIARAVHADAKILVLDEPTTTLEQREKEQLFKVISDLKAGGTSVIFISHHLEEIKEICDRVVILRDGVVVTDKTTTDLDAKAMIAAMTGKTPDDQYPKEHIQLGETVLSVSGLTLARSYYDVSFDLQAGEILGIVGLVGCGKSSLIRSIFGAVTPDSGAILLNGEIAPIRSVRAAIRRRLSYLPSDRKTEGIFSPHSVEWNMTIGVLGSFSRWFGIDRRRERETVLDRVRAYGVKLASPRQAITSLSGGNQQKVLFARSLMSNPKVLLLEEPTRGIDVNAKTDVYRLITDYVRAGNSVILVSSEEGEVLGMADRILVMREGRIRASLSADQASLDQIKLYSMSNEQ